MDCEIALLGFIRNRAILPIAYAARQIAPHVQTATCDTNEAHVMQ